MASHIAEHISTIENIPCTCSPEHIFCCGFLQATVRVIFRDSGIRNVRLGLGINYKLNTPFSGRVYSRGRRNLFSHHTGHERSSWEHSYTCKIETKSHLSYMLRNSKGCGRETLQKDAAKGEASRKMRKFRMLSEIARSLKSTAIFAMSQSYQILRLPSQYSAVVFRV